MVDKVNMVHLQVKKFTWQHLRGRQYEYEDNINTVRYTYKIDMNDYVFAEYLKYF